MGQGESSGGYNGDGDKDGVSKSTPDWQQRPDGTSEAPGAMQTGPRGRTDSDVPEGADHESGAEGSGHQIFEMNVADLKGQDDFRLQYLQRLSSQKVWVPRDQRPPKHQTVVIFDWDDTLLPTSFLNMRQDTPISPVVERHLRAIEAADKKLLEQAMKLGHTFIITNAMNGWVEYSAAKYVPDLLKTLEKIPVISARSKFESSYPGEVNKWKVNAFLEVQRQLNSEIITNLISLGDSNFEMDAVHVMGKEFSQALVKTIKFRESPSPEELLKQLELVGQKFERIVENARNLKIGLERKWVGAGGAAGAQGAAAGSQPSAEAPAAASGSGSGSD